MLEIAKSLPRSSGATHNEARLDGREVKYLAKGLPRKKKKKGRKARSDKNPTSRLRADY
jgi:hypothetical protein